MYQITSHKYLSEQEQEALNGLIQKSKDTRDSIIIELAIHTGARIQEILNTTTNDLNDHHRTIFIKGLKGSKDRELPLPNEFYKRLKAYVSISRAELRDTDKLFPMSQRRLAQIWEQYRPNKTKGFHSLRHTFAINLYKRTKDLKLVQTALGHKNIQNTMVYADYVYSTTELRKALIA